MAPPVLALTYSADYKRTWYLNFHSDTRQQAIVYVPKGSKEFYLKANGWNEFLCITEEGELEDITSLKEEIAALKSENATLIKEVETLKAGSVSYDINGDGKVTIADVTTLIDMIVNK